MAIHFHIFICFWGQRRSQQKNSNKINIINLLMTSSRPNQLSVEISQGHFYYGSLKKSKQIELPPANLKLHIDVFILFLANATGCEAPRKIVLPWPWETTHCDHRTHPPRKFSWERYNYAHLTFLVNFFWCLRIITPLYLNNRIGISRCVRAPFLWRWN